MALKWNLSDAIAFAKSVEKELLPHYHVALGGSVLVQGFSRKDLDLLVYPHDSTKDWSIAGRQRAIHICLERIIGFTRIVDSDTVRKAWRKRGSKDNKVVEVWQILDRRVDVFYVA